MTYLIALLFLTACSLKPASREPASFPDSYALKSWKESTDRTLGEGNLDSFPRVEIDCPEKNLYPTHPQEDLKILHRYNTADYDKKKLDAFDQACVLSSKAGKGKKKDKLTCMRANIAVDTIMSDTYMDSCGHRYRAFWQLEYLKNEERPETLVSKGRSIKHANEEMPDLSTVGATESVSSSNFMFVSPLLPGDQEKIDQLKTKSELTHTWNDKTLLFESK